jgi:hypothetical protein
MAEKIEKRWERDSAGQPKTAISPGKKFPGKKLHGKHLNGK